MLRIVCAVAALAVCFGTRPLISASPNYRLLKSIPIGGDGGWDYVAADSKNRRLYVSHGTLVEVLDLDSEKIVGRIPNTNGVHGIAIADDLGRGFISAGRDKQIVIFDLKTLKPLGAAKAGTNPDGIVYEPVTHRVFAFNGGSHDATVVNGADGNVAGTIPLAGKPEFPVVDGEGNLFVNIEDKNEIDQIDPKGLKVMHRWSIAPAESPSGLAIDAKGHRVFAVCDGKVMVVLNTENGKVVATVPIGEGPDAAAYDPGTHLVFSSNGEGTVTVIRQDSKDRYSVEASAPTQKGARTMAVDLKTHRIYLPDADFGPAPAATPSGTRRWPPIVAGSFKLLVLSE